MNKKVIKKADIEPNNCPVTFCLSRIGGKWKPIILYLLSKGVNRFGILQRAIEGISKQMLTQQLRELEKDAIITRTVYPQVPPKVEYFLTDYGKSLLPVINSMKRWGEKHMSL
ncbi:MAG: helix-turn-helix domain-containing protein [Spirochaetota bacterium]